MRKILLSLKLILFAGMLVLGAQAGAGVGQEDPLSDNYYERLGEPRTATLEELQKAYRQIRTKYHPDKAPELSDALIKNIYEAWETLKDPVKRAEFDATLPTENALSRPPRGWTGIWDGKASYEKNIFVALVGADDTNRALVFSLAEGMDWSDQGRASKEFVRIAEMVIHGRFSNTTKLVDNLFSFSKSTQFPQLMEGALRTDLAPYIVGSLLTKDPWRNHPQRSEWLASVMFLDSPAMTQALVEKYLPTLETTLARTLFFKEIVFSAGPRSKMWLNLNRPKAMKVYGGSANSCDAKLNTN